MADDLPAVHVRQCSKEYQIFRWRLKNRSTSVSVFDKLDMTVPSGSMYALLGPSGCGKTTLLKCIMGRLQVDSGSIAIFGRPLKLHNHVKAAEIGYMPQETSLFTLLTIEETLQYYGKVLGLTNDFIKCQIKFFVEFLRLPKKNTINHQLSGGQMRRLSFAVAAIHQPRLLIMDEPTVGVDPIIRQRMWSYLKYMMQNYSTSIIITTHYIEEARSADLVGLMQNGSMLAEGSPDSLMSTWKVATLEELFFKVYTKHLTDGTNRNQPETELSSKQTNQTHCQVQKCGINSDDGTTNIKQTLNELRSRNEELSKDTDFLKLSRLSAIVTKNFIRLYRFPFALAFLVLLPALQMVNVIYASGSNITDLDVGVFNDDAGHMADVYLQSLDANVVNQIQYHSYESGYQAVVKKQCSGFIYLQRNFSEAIIERYLDVTMIREHVLESGLINITIDRTEFAIAEVLAFQLFSAVTSLSSRALLDAGYSANLSKPFMEVSFQPKQLIGGPIFLTILPSHIIMLMYIIQIGMSLLFLFLEKTSGYLERSLVSGVTFFEIIVGFGIIQFFVSLVQAFALLAVTYVAFSSVLIGSLGLTVFFSILSGLGGMAMGLFVSAWLDQLLVIASIGISVIFVLPAITGAFLPLQAATSFFQYFCACLPFYLPKEALTHIMYRNSGLFDANVAIGIAIMLTWIFIFMAMSILCLRRNVK